jgi:hypothetical protein
MIDGSKRIPGMEDIPTPKLNRHASIKQTYVIHLLLQERSAREGVQPYAVSFIDVALISQSRLPGEPMNAGESSFSALSAGDYYLSH